MFNLSFSEISLILVVALFIFDQQDLLKIIKFFKQLKKKTQKYYADCCGYLNDSIANDELPEIKEIIDLEGEVRQAYSINHLDKLINSKSEQNSDGKS